MFVTDQFDRMIAIAVFALVVAHPGPVFGWPRTGELESYTAGEEK